MFYAKYDAIDIAEYVLWFCEKILNKPITNLKLQKILYYIQGRYLAEYDKPLFDNDMEAWDYGPVIPDVYFEYRQFKSNPIKGIKPMDEFLLDDETEELIQNTTIDKYNLDPWKLVKDTHSEDPWINNFDSGYNNLISIKELKEFFNNV